MTTLAFVMLVIIIFTGVLGLESTAGGQRPVRTAGLWSWLTTGNWSAKLGAGLIILGVGALLRYLLIHVEVPDTLKLGSGAAVSAVLALAALALRARPERRGLRLALAGAAGGVAYLTAYSAYALFHYVAESSTAFSLLLLVAVMVGVIAVRERAQSMAVLAMMGGFMAPYFALEQAPPLTLNGYYLLLSVLVLVMVDLRGWRPLIHLSFLFTLAATLFFGWSNNYYQPEHYVVMQPMLLALTAVHLAMPLVEALHGSQHVAWLRRVDQGYALVLPLTAVALALKLAPTGEAASIAIAQLAGVWLLGAALAYFTRQSPERHLWLAGLLVLVALALYLRDLHLPWPLLGTLLACALYVAAPRLGLQGAHQDWLALLVLVLGAAQVAESAFGAAAYSHMGLAYAEKFTLAGALLGIAWVSRRRGNGFVEIMAWAGGLWGTLSLLNLLIDLNLDHWPSILFITGLVASLALFALRWTPHPAAPGALAILLTVVGQKAATETALPWTAVLAVILMVTLFLLVLTAQRPSSERPGQDSSNTTVVGTALLLLPLALWPWLRVIGQQMDWRGSSFSLSALMLGVLISAVFAQRQLPRESRWHRELAPAVFYAVCAVLALRLIGHIERGWWAVVFELLALLYLGLRAFWMSREKDEPDNAPTRHHLLIGVLLVALFVQAQALRLWGPVGAVLTMLDLGRMAAPVLLSLLWAALGALLTIGGHRLKERLVWSTGAGLLVLAAGKIVLLDSGSLGSLPNILAVIAAGGLFLAVSWWAPFPPARPAPRPKPKPKRTPRRSAETTAHAAGVAAVSVTPPQAPHAQLSTQWQDTQASGAPNPPKVDSSFDDPTHHAARPTRHTAPTQPPSSRAWGWVIVGGIALLTWTGYQSFQKSQRQERIRAVERAEQRHTAPGPTPPHAQSTAPSPRQSHAATPVPAPSRAKVQASIAPRPAEPIKNFEFQSPPQQACAFADVLIPDNIRVYAAGGYAGRNLDFQIDASGHQARQFDVAVNSPAQPVALILGAYEPTVWNIGWTEGTQILAVVVSGYHRQQIAGLPSSVPVINSSADNRGGCRYSHINRKDNSKLNPLAQQLFGRPVDMVYPGDNSGSIMVGQPISSSTRLQTSGAVTPESFRDKNAPLAGRAGLDEAVRKGLIRLANRTDIDAWMSAVADRGRGDNPPIAGQNKPTPPTMLRTLPAYVVLKPFTYPAGLYGAHSVSFFIPVGAPRPTGNPGHSSIYDFNTLQCRLGNMLCPGS